MLQKTVYLGVMLSGAILLSACDSSQQNKNTDEHTSILQKDQAEVLPYLNMKEAKAEYALPFCEKKNCIDLDIQTIKTQDQIMQTLVNLR